MYRHIVVRIEHIGIKDQNQLVILLGGRGSKRSGYLNVGMSIQTLFVTVSHSSPSTILGHLKHPFDSVQALCQVGERWAKGETDKVVTRRVKQITTVSWVDVEEYSGYHDCLLFEQFFKECQAVVQRYWKLLQVKPYVEGTCGRDVDIEMKFVESIEDVVTFRFEVLLKGNFLHCDSGGFQERQSRKLHRMIGSPIEERS